MIARFPSPRDVGRDMKRPEAGPSHPSMRENQREGADVRMRINRGSKARSDASLMDSRAKEGIRLMRASISPSDRESVGLGTLYA